jgi:tetratricopeptide (TPR) repeat protein
VALGQVLADTGHAKEALSDLDAAIQRPGALTSPVRPLAWGAAGQAYARSARAWALELLDRPQEADSEMAEALAATPGNAWAWLRRARIHVRRGKYREAMADLEAALSLEDPPLTAFQRAQATKLMADIQRDAELGWT